MMEEFVTTLMPHLSFQGESGDVKLSFESCIKSNRWMQTQSIHGAMLSKTENESHLWHTVLTLPALLGAT